MKTILALLLLAMSVMNANAQGTGSNPSDVHSSAPPVVTGTPDDPTGKFVALVLGDTEDTWKEIFAANGRTYHPPRLRLFSGAEQGGCGLARSAMGPFYCPNDQRIYLDTAFFDDLQRKFGGCANRRTRGRMPSSSCIARIEEIVLSLRTVRPDAGQATARRSKTRCRYANSRPTTECYPDPLLARVGPRLEH
jgi:Putative neutral zinc metallopeptidase